MTFALIIGLSLTGPAVAQQAAPSFVGCRLTTARTVSELGGSLGGPNAWEFRLQVLWCAHGGILSKAQIVHKDHLMGHVPFWHVRDDSDNSYERGGEGSSRWVVHEAATAEFACAGGVDVPLIGGWGDFCLHHSSTYIQLSVDATIGQVDVACGFPACEIASDETLA